MCLVPQPSGGLSHCEPSGLQEGTWCLSSIVYPPELPIVVGWSYEQHLGIYQVYQTPCWAP